MRAKKSSASESGDVPKWLKGPHSKCGRSGNRRKGSNPFISALFIDIPYPILYNRVHIFMLEFMFDKKLWQPPFLGGVDTWVLRDGCL